MDAALNVVPAAVLTTLVAPAFIGGGTDTKMAMALALAVGLRFSSTAMLVVGWVIGMAWRHFAG